MYVHVDPHQGLIHSLTLKLLSMYRILGIPEVEILLVGIAITGIPLYHSLGSQIQWYLLVLQLQKFTFLQPKKLYCAQQCAVTMMTSDMQQKYVCCCDS